MSKKITTAPRHHPRPGKHQPHIPARNRPRDYGNPGPRRGR